MYKRTIQTCLQTLTKIANSRYKVLLEAPRYRKYARELLLLNTQSQLNAKELHALFLQKNERQKD